MKLLDREILGVTIEVCGMPFLLTLETQALARFAQRHSPRCDDDGSYTMRLKLSPDVFLVVQLGARGKGLAIDEHEQG